MGELFYSVSRSTGKVVTSIKKFNNYFETKEEAIAAYNAYNIKLELRKKDAWEIAKLRLEEIEKKFELFMKENDCEISYTMDGDTHGIHDDYMYIEVKVDGFCFTKRISG